MTWVNDAPHDSTRHALEEEETTAPPPDGWRLDGLHFVLSFERLATLVAWKHAVTVDNPTNNTSLESANSGTDATFLSVGNTRSPSTATRVAFDAILDGGFTFGGAIGYASSTGKRESDAVSPEASLPDDSFFVFTGRLGYFLPATDSVGIWFRGGFSRFASSADAQATINNRTVEVKEVVGAWDLAIDPQLVLVAAPRFGITLGPILDIPITGGDRVTSDGVTREVDYSSSAYGVSAGAAAIF